MWCISIASLYLIFKVIFSSEIFAAIFISATGLLFHLYLIIGIISIGFMALMSLGILSAATLAGLLSKAGKLGGFVGFLGGGAITVPVLLITALKKAGLVGVAYMLSTKAVTIPAEGAAVWNLPILIISGVILVIILKWNK